MSSRSALLALLTLLLIALVVSVGNATQGQTAASRSDSLVQAQSTQLQAARRTRCITRASENAPRGSAEFFT